MYQGSEAQVYTEDSVRALIYRQALLEQLLLLWLLLLLEASEPVRLVWCIVRHRADY